MYIFTCAACMSGQKEGLPGWCEDAVVVFARLGQYRRLPLQVVLLLMLPDLFIKTPSTRQ
jgi:hypothetical protein